MPSVSGMLSRTCVEVIKRSGNSYLSKMRFRKMHTSNEVDTLDLPVFKHPLAQVIFGIPAGQLSGLVGTICGGTIGATTSLPPALIMGEKKFEKVFGAFMFSGAVLGGLGAGALGASFVGGRRGIISCGITTVLLGSIRYWESFDTEKKQRILQAFKEDKKLELIQENQSVRSIPRINKSVENNQKIAPSDINFQI